MREAGCAAVRAVAPVGATEGFLLGDAGSIGTTSMALRRDAAGLFTSVRIGAISAYDEFLAYRTAGGGTGHRVVEQGIVRQLV